LPAIAGSLGTKNFGLTGKRRSILTGCVRRIHGVAAQMFDEAIDRQANHRRSAVAPWRHDKIAGRGRLSRQPRSQVRHRAKMTFGEGYAI